MNAFVEARRLSAANMAGMPIFCSDRPPISGIKSLPYSLNNRGHFLKRSPVICSLRGQAAMAERIPDGSAAYRSWLSRESSEIGNFGGWSDICSSEDFPPNVVYLLEPLSSSLLGDFKIPDFAGFLQGGAGITLAISFALAFCLAFSRTGLTFRNLTSEQQMNIFPMPAPTESKEGLQSQNMAQIKEREVTDRKILGSMPTKAVLELVSRLWIRGYKEPLHDHALSILQTLKIAEPSCQSVDLCTRREYARWLVLASNILCRKPSDRICPATYIKGSTSLAFDDILPEDRDFPYIQGMAEAGLIANKFDLNQSNDFDSIAPHHNKINDNALFLPDSFVCRQDIVSWKIALDHRFWWRFGDKVAERKSWYFDIENIPAAAKSAILLDLYAGETSIAASAFGYTRRFQPEHPVTHGQAALAIISGEMAAAVSEEIAKLQKENLKNEGIMKELVSEVSARKEQDAEFKKVLAKLREKRIVTEKTAEARIQKANVFKAKRWNATLSFERESATIKLEKMLLARLKDDLLELSDALSVEETNIQLDKKRLAEMKANAEKEKQAFLCHSCNVKAEMRAVKFARVWTEDQAKRALTYAKMLEQSKKYWGQRKNKECCLETGKQSEGSLVRSMSENRGGTDEGLALAWSSDKQFDDVAKQKTQDLLQEFKEKCREMQSILSIVDEKVQVFQMHARQRFHHHFSNYASSSVTNAKK